MKQMIRRSVLCSVLLGFSVFTYAASSSTDGTSNSGSGSMAAYFTAYAKYIGINITTNNNGPGVIPPTTPSMPSVTSTTALALWLVAPMANALVEQAQADALLWPNFTTSTNGTGVSVNDLLDVGGTGQTYQATSTLGYGDTPVRQLVLNILGRAGEDYQQINNNCSTSNQTSFGCQPVINRVIGAITNVAGSDYKMSTLLQPLSGVADQLNANSLLEPLAYQSPASGSSTSSSTGSNSSDDTGLQSSNSGSTAQNFIRYLSYESVNPLVLTSAEEGILMNWLSDVDSTVSNCTVQNSRTKLSQYLIDLRHYAAQMSVGMGNLVNMLARRMPNSNNQDANGNAQSAVQAEYNMATRRIFNPNEVDKATAWQKNIQSASLLELMRQMNYLLADMNYQMYLNRMQQERLLLTLSTLQLQQAVSGRTVIKGDIDNAGAGYCSTSSSS